MPRPIRENPPVGDWGWPSAGLEGMPGKAVALNREILAFLNKEGLNQQAGTWYKGPANDIGGLSWHNEKNRDQPQGDHR